MNKITALRDATAKAGDTSVTLVDRRKSVIDAGKAFVTELSALDREPTEEEAAVLAEAAAALEALDTQIEKADTSAGVLTKMAGGQRSGAPYEDTTRLNLGSAGRKAASVPISYKMDRTRTDETGPSGEKALAPAGTAVTSIPLDNRPVPIGQVATSALDVLPAIKRAPIYRYLRQTLREMNAGVVAPGALKPTSKIGIEQIESRLKVVAHVSEAIDKFMLEDAASLDQFVRDELIYGLSVELERLVVAGVLADDGMTGILNTSGVQIQPFVADATTSIRKSITLLDTSGHKASALLVHPLDWEGIELARRNDGQFDHGSALPVERAALRTWSLPTATTVALPVGTALVLDTNAVSVATDGTIEVKWSENVGNDFELNQLRARCETRANVDVFAPRAVVKVELDA
ncbi:MULTISPECIES: phage major capsid protein [Actinomycetes]|uniref:phage major capsid protein n=1 Tax=Actinomycetes TaxID=1760 RepID=UPI00069202D9|nr:MULTISPECIES: phage major capsid protein [Actinomycetes]